MPENYEPFGEEWKKEVMKMTKEELIYMLRNALMKSIKYQDLANADIPTELRNHYRPLLIKNSNYQMGDDNYALTTKELLLITGLSTILKDLEL